jgi:phosphoenolpyruvate carboxylase
MSRRCSVRRSVEAAGDILSRLINDPIYRVHLAARGNRQVVMIGYADSNKESGITASRWLLRKAQVAMQAACAASKVQLVVFTVVGIGQPGRQSHRSHRAQPADRGRGSPQVTEQGETINDRYGLQPIAVRTFEQGLNTQPGDAGKCRAIDPRWKMRWMLAMPAA